MCKYCEMMHVNTETGECHNDIPTICEVDLGTLHSELMLNRYDDKMGCKTNQLIVGVYVDTDAGYNSMGSKSIEIKYCPFCGEKL